MSVPLCSSQGTVIYSVQGWDTLHDQWSLVQQTVIEHCALKHLKECQVLLGMGMDELRNMEMKVTRNARCASSTEG